MSNLRNELTALGLGQHEADVYGALLAVEAAQVSDLAAVVPIDRPNIYVALQRLQHRGMVKVIPNRPALFSAYPPQDAFRSVLDAEQARLDVKAGMVRSLADVFAQRKPRLKSLPAMEVQRLLPGGRHAGNVDRQRWLDKVRSEYVYTAIRDAPGVKPEDRQRGDRGATAAAKRGVRFRGVLKASVLDCQVERKRYAEAHSSAAEVRVVEHLPLALSVVDDKVAWFQSPGMQGERTAVRVNDPDVVQMLRDYFEYHWSKGEDLMSYLARRWPDEYGSPRKKAAGRAGRARTGGSRGSAGRSSR